MLLDLYIAMRGLKVSAGGGVGGGGVEVRTSWKITIEPSPLEKVGSPGLLENYNS